MHRLHLESNIKIITFFEIFSALVFFVPVFVLYLEGKFGLSDALLLQSIFVVSSAIFEVPCGVFADKFGKKLSLILGSFLLSVIIFIYGIVDDFIIFIVVEIFLGFGYAFISGTSSALLYESLVKLNREDEYKKIYGKISQYALWSVAVASILGGLIAKYALEYTFFASAISLFVAFLIAFRIKEPKAIKKKTEQSFILNASKELLVKNRLLRYVLIISTMTYIFNQQLFFLYQPYMKYNGVDVVYFGVILASFQIVSGFASRYAHVFEKNFGFLHSLWILFIISIVSIFLLGNIVGVFSFMFIYFQQIVRGIRLVIVNDFINKNISSKYRTTILSLESFLTKIIYIPFMLLLSMLSDRFALVEVINIIGIIATIFMGIAILGSLVSIKKRGKIPKKRI